MIARIRNLERLLLFEEPDQPIVERQPILGKHADVDVNANGCAGHPDGIRAVLQNVRHRHLLFFSWQGEGSASHFFRHGDPLAFRKQKDWVDRIWIVDVIRRDSGSVGSAARLGSQHFVEETTLLDVAGEDLSFIDVLIANCRRQVLPARIFRIGWRVIWVRRDVTGAAGNADAIRTNKFVIVVIGRIVHETIAVPFLACFVVEIWIREQAVAEHTRGLAINLLVNPGSLGLRLLIEPQAIFIRFACSAKPRFVHHAQSFEPLTARIFPVIEHL